MSWGIVSWSSLGLSVSNKSKMVGLGVSDFGSVLWNSVHWCWCWLIVILAVVSWGMDWSWSVMRLSQLWVIENWVGWQSLEGALVSGEVDLLLVLNLRGVNWSD
jgi:hypothetical protein